MTACCTIRPYEPIDGPWGGEKEAMSDARERTRAAIKNAATKPKPTFEEIVAHINKRWGPLLKRLAQIEAREKALDVLANGVEGITVGCGMTLAEIQVAALEDAGLAITWKE